MNFNLQIFVSLLLLAENSLQSGLDFNFCNLKCDNEEHTVCKLKHNCGPGSGCEKYESFHLTKKDKQSILDLHNKLRNKVALGNERRSLTRQPQPSAADMRELVWDEELEFLAQCWANQCTTTHDGCRKKSDDGEVGQNLAFYTKENDILGAIERFYEECAFLDIKQVSNFEGEQGNDVIGHYTQLIFSNSTQLGCARSKYFYAKWSMQIEFLVCHYLWAGNWLGAPLYKIGKPCSACPKGSKCHAKYKGLCTTKLSAAKAPNICKYSSDKNCKPILNNGKNIKPSGGETATTKKTQTPTTYKNSQSFSTIKLQGSSDGNNGDSNLNNINGEDGFDGNISGNCIIERNIIVLNGSADFGRIFLRNLLIAMCILFSTANLF